MAGEAARKFIVEQLIVRLAMAVGALRHIAVLVLVTGDAREGPVFGGALRQCVQYLGMTGTAGGRRHIFAERDLPRLVNRMTLEAGLQCQPLGMRFVAGKAGRLETVRCVARHAGNLRVLARECDELFTDGAVAVEAAVCKQGR